MDLLNFSIRFFWAAFWQALILAGLYWTLTRLSRRWMSAATRHTLAMTALSLSLIVPLVTAAGGFGGLRGVLQPQSGKGTDSAISPGAPRQGPGVEGASEEPSQATGPYAAQPDAASSSPLPSDLSRSHVLSTPPSSADAGPGLSASSSGSASEAAEILRSGSVLSPLTLPAGLALCLLGACLLMASWRWLRLLREVALLTLRKASGRKDAQWQSWLRERRDVIGLRRAAQVLRAGVASPMAVGFLRPAILLPESLKRLLSEDETRHVVAHEAAHLARRDDWANLWQQLIRASLAFHPAVWWLDTQASQAREMACDDRVVRLTGRRKDYARSLLKVMESCGRRAVPSLAAGAALRGQMSERVRRVLDPSTPNGAKPRPVYACLVFVLFCLAVAGGLLPPQVQVAASLEKAPGIVPGASRANSPQGEFNRTYTHDGDDRFLRVQLRGQVEVTSDDRWIRSLTPGGRLVIEEEVDGTRRRIDFKTDSSGELAYEFASNRDGDGEPRLWLASLLPELVLEVGLAAPQRVARILRSGGPPAVLEEMTKISKDSVFSRYFEALLESGSLSPAHKAEVLRLMSAQVESESKKGKMLRSAASRFLQPADLAERYFQAISAISSDSTKKRVLVDVAEEAFRRPQVLPAYLDAVSQIDSDSSKKKALEMLFRHPGLSEETLRRLLAVADGIGSDSSKGRLLAEIGGQVFEVRGVVPDFLSVLEGIRSDSSKGRVVRELFQLPGASDEVRIGLLDVAQLIRSDSTKSRLVLRLAPVVGESGTVRAALERLLQSIRSSSARQRAEKAL
ncbi:MAG TPA: M56 family metallopeptidase [Acidobacteriota bacterium]|nr:M56 family metallopeptidase [Acidobacteriota bacterium]